MLNFRFKFFCVTALFISAIAALCGEDPGMPASLKPWAAPEYARRYFLKVEAPGDAGAAGVQGNPGSASVALPLRVLGEGAVRRGEPIELVGEDGAVQVVSTRPVEGGSDIEVVFQTYPGQRRFCLYTE